MISHKSGPKLTELFSHSKLRHNSLMKTLPLLAALCMVAASGWPIFSTKVSIKQLARLWPRTRQFAHYAISGRLPRNFGGMEGQLVSPTEQDETGGDSVGGKRVAWPKAAYLRVGEGV